MKKFKYYIIAVILLFAVGKVFYSKYSYYKKRYTVAYNNMMAYEAEKASLLTKNIQLHFTIDELSSSRDSINQKLVATIKELGIKNKNVNSVQYITSTITRTDTITLKGDTIFKEPSFSLDTIVGDNWYTTNISLHYPSTIITTPSFRSEKHIVLHTKKEYYKKPSKLFFIRWFQKKYKAVEVEVVEKNPYIENNENRFIEIIK